MPKTKRDEKEDIQNRPNKKRILDQVLDTDAKYLVRDFSSADELLRLYDKVIDLEEELVEKMQFDEGVKNVEGAKTDNNRLMFLVRWEDDDRSFVPSNVLKKIAPQKLIQYYESRLQFNKSPPGSGEVGVENLIKGAQQTKKKLVETIPKKEAPPPHLGLSLEPKPIMKRYLTTHCKGCKILLQYPDGTKVIRCPKCMTTMNTPEFVLKI